MSNTDDFLPNDYKEPTVSNYFKAAQGDNIVRILTKPILGYEYFIKEDGKPKPIRKRVDEPIVIGDVPADSTVKFFWAMTIWNYDAKRIQIWEITQKSIREAITKLRANKSWGTPKDYDLTLNRTGEGFDTEYLVMPNPKAPLEKHVQEKLDSTPVNLEALYDGGDPFSTEEIVGDVDIDNSDLVDSAL
jgi:hypothetical protein